MESKNNLLIIGIIGIVAIIGIVMMILTITNENMYNSAISDTDDVGQVPSDLVSKTDYWWCSDSDGGVNYNSRGVIIGVDKHGGVNPGADYCDPKVGPNILMEGFCDKGYADFMLYDCLNGCSDGACIIINKPICSDSDGGRNYSVRGIIKGTDKYGNSNPGIDYCTSALNLMEGFCEEGYANFIEYTCPNKCRNGACV